jgi:hypothetical protein
MLVLFSLSGVLHSVSYVLKKAPGLESPGYGGSLVVRREINPLLNALVEDAIGVQGQD